MDCIRSIKRRDYFQELRTEFRKDLTGFNFSAICVACVQPSRYSRRPETLSSANILVMMKGVYTGVFAKLHH